jgi:hypothetical protein
VTPSESGACEAFVCDDWPCGVGEGASSSTSFGSTGRRLGEGREGREEGGGGASKKFKGETLLPAVWKGRFDDEREFERARGAVDEVCGKTVDDEDEDVVAPVTRGSTL